MREAIFQRLTKREQEHDGADKGIGVLIKIDARGGRARQAAAVGRIGARTHRHILGSIAVSALESKRLSNVAGATSENGPTGDIR